MRTRMKTVLEYPRWVLIEMFRVSIYYLMASMSAPFWIKLQGQLLDKNTLAGIMLLSSVSGTLAFLLKNISFEKKYNFIFWYVIIENILTIIFLPELETSAVVFGLSIIGSLMSMVIGSYVVDYDGLMSQQVPELFKDILYYEKFFFGTAAIMGGTIAVLIPNATIAFLILAISGFFQAYLIILNKKELRNEGII